MDNQLRQGPATFALDTSGDGPVGALAVPQLGTSPTANPGPIAPTPSFQAGVSDADSKTLRAITDLASGMLAPKIKQAAEDQYVKGVQQAMTGEGLQDILKDKPWYTDIFAPSAASEGARAYTAQKAVAQWAGKMQEQMPVLARQDPDALQKAATDAMRGFMTGDPKTDAQMTAMVTEQMAPLFKQHAKEHYVYMQQQATLQQIGAWEALGKVYQGFAADAASGKGTVSPDDLEAAKSRFLGAVTPFADQSDMAFSRNVATFLEGTAADGNFQVIKLFKDTGLYDKIDPEHRMQVDRTMRVYGRQALNKVIPQFSQDIAMLVNDMTQDPRGIPDKIAALNARAAAITGVTEADMIPPEAVDNVVGNVMRAQRSEADAQARAAQSAQQKDLAKTAAVALASSQFSQGPGAVDRCEVTKMCDGAAVETAGSLAYQAAKTPQDRAQVLNMRVLKPFNSIKSSFVATLRSPEYQGGVGDTAQVYKALSEDVKTRYFDENDRALLDRFNQLVSANTPPQAAWIAARAAPAMSDGATAMAAKDPLSQAIRSEVEKQNETWYHANNVDDASLQMLTGLAARAYKLDSLNNPPDVAAKRAYASIASHVDLQGKHAIYNAQDGAPKLFQVIGEGMKDTASAFEDVMAERAKAQGVPLKNYEIVRVPDRNGAAYFQVLATNDEGHTVAWSFSSQDVKARVEENVRKEKSRTPQPGTSTTAPAIGPEGASFGPYPSPGRTALSTPAIGP